MAASYRAAAGDAYGRHDDDKAAAYRRAAADLESLAGTLPSLPTVAGPTPR
jgi:hypothetical protein